MKEGVRLLLLCLCCVYLLAQRQRVGAESGLAESRFGLIKVASLVSYLFKFIKCLVKDVLIEKKILIVLYLIK